MTSGAALGPCRQAEGTLALDSLLVLSLSQALTSLSVVELEPRHLDSRARDAIGRAMLANPE